MRLIDLIWVTNNATEIEVRDLSCDCVYRGPAGCVTILEAKEWRVVGLVPRYVEQYGTILKVDVEEACT